MCAECFIKYIHDARGRRIPENESGTIDVTLEYKGRGEPSKSEEV